GRTKNHRKHTVPLGRTALGILASLPRIGETYVFTTTGTTPASGFAKGKRRLDALLDGVPAWCLHDLRRTVASGMARLGVSLPVVEKLLNHSSGSFAGIVSVYQKHDFAREKREAMEVWGRHVVALTQPSDVTTHKERAAG